MKPKRHVYFVNEPNWLVQCVLGKWEMNKLEIKVNFFLHIPFTVKIEKFCACDFQHSGWRRLSNRADVIIYEVCYYNFYYI